MTSSEMENAISNRFVVDPALKDVKVSADAEKNEVTLSGSVETQDQRNRALDAVRSVNTATLVTDKIDVKPRDVARTEYTEDMARQARERSKELGDKIGDTVDDAWIHTKITTKLLSDKDTPARKINVDVMNNVVTLRGKVQTAAAKIEAERIAKETDGVKRVVNLLTVEA